MTDGESADAVDDPVLAALLEQRPIVALILRAHPHDHVTVYDNGITVTFGRHDESGTVTVAAGLAARLRPDP